MKHIFMVGAMVLAIGCTPANNTPPVNEGLAYFQVKFDQGVDIGTRETPLPYQGTYSFNVTVNAMGYDMQPFPSYEGTVQIHLQYAQMTSVARLDLVQGTGQILVEWSYGADKEIITVHEIQEQGGTAFETGKLGVSSPIYTPPATIQMLQGTHDGSARNGFVSRYNHRNLTLHGQEMIVIAVIEGGFYLTQLGAADHASLYLYTHSTPYVDDADEFHALQPGSLIDEVNGSVFEFFGFTEMSFPTFVPKRNSDNSVVVDASRIPAPHDITSYLDANQDEELEKWESSLVTVTNVTVTDFDEKDTSFVEFSQYPLRTSGGGYIMAVTLYTAPTFRPTTNKGKPIARLTGVLKQHRAARPSTWILTPRNIDDIEFE